MLLTQRQDAEDLEMKHSTACILTCVLIVNLSLIGCALGGGATSAAASATPEPASGGPAQPPTSTAAPATSAPQAGSGACDNPLYPVVEGATWSYTVTGGPAGPVSYTTSVASVDAQGFELMQAFTSLTVTQRWSCSDAGLVALDFGGPAASLVTEGSQASFTTTAQTGVTLPKSVAPGDSWSQSFEITGTQTLTGGNTGNSQGKASYQSSAVGMEDVTVDAGTFNAMRVDGQLSVDLTVEAMGVTTPVTLTSNFTSWYAPGVGLVKVAESGQVMGAAISVETDLTSYSIP
jgi:hypothetical protein